ncbi:MAG: hypothetical protein U0744_13375 [Gemmataceae bacterium]
MTARKPPVQSAMGFRIFVFVFCATVLATMVYTLIVAPNPLTPGAGIASSVVGVLLAAGIVFAIAWKPPSAEKSHAALMIDAPSFSDQALVCRHTGLFGKAQVAILDEMTGMIHFGNCHTPRRFLGTTERWRSCPIKEVIAAHPFASKGHESLTVVTQAGNALLYDGMENYQAFRERLEALLPPWQAGYSAEHPMMGFIYVGAALVGVLLGGGAGVWIGPKNPGDATWLLIGAFAGAIAMVALARVGVMLADRYLGVSIVPPIALAGFGAVLGFMLTNWLDLSLPFGLFPPIVGTLAGFVAGIVKLKRGSREFNDPINE